MKYYALYKKSDHSITGVITSQGLDEWRVGRPAAYAFFFEQIALLEITSAEYGLLFSLFRALGSTIADP